MLTPGQVAQRANVHVNSIRNWSREYADLLSPQASGKNGVRLFTDDDVTTMTTIAALRKSGVPPSGVAERIRNHEAPPVVDVDADRLQSSIQESHNALQTTQVLPQALQIANNALQSRVDVVERRLDAQAAEHRAHQHDRLWTLGLGVLIGMVMMMGLLFLAWLLVNV